MKQLLLFPDPRPLVERLGVEFFRQVPEHPGVYLMRNERQILYVGKAKNLRKRLSHYRVANPDRKLRRHLRLLRAVEHIDFECCADEQAAVARESELLRALRPRFNRAGTWVGPRRFILWRVNARRLELRVDTAVEPGWQFSGPLGSSAFSLRAVLVRVLWCALNPERGLRGMPCGWFSGRYSDVVGIGGGDDFVLKQAAELLQAASLGFPNGFAEWIQAHLGDPRNIFEETAIRENLALVCDFFRTPAGPSREE